MITWHVELDGLKAKVARLQKLAGDLSGLLAVMGREARNRLLAHFRSKDRNEPNRLGGSRTHFWLEVSRSVQAPVQRGDKTVVVSITHPSIAQKVHGGRITAKRAKALTIPVSKEAYGRTAATLEHELGIKLFVVPGEFGRGLLAAAMKNGRIQVHYLLRRSVNQKPDPTALPDTSPGSAFATSIQDRARSYIQRVTGGALPGNVQQA